MICLPNFFFFVKKKKKCHIELCCLMFEGKKQLFLTIINRFKINKKVLVKNKTGHT